ncbi:MAG: retropepsin-like aspartic protease [Bacteroidales bacterium]|jgi:predicted aspartyl protease
MKYIKICLTGFFCFFMVSCVQQDNKSFNEIHALIEKSNYFAARELLDLQKQKLSARQELVIAAILDNAFNLNGRSQEKVDRLLAKTRLLPDTLLSRLYAIREDNAIKLYQYREAARADSVRLHDFGHILTETQKKDIHNKMTLWSALSNVSPQQVIIEGETVLELQKDMAGLDNITISADGDTLGFIFDTGANLSTVCLSVAEKMRMDIIPSEILVGSITGEKVPAQLAVCDQMSIDKIVVKNVVFLVFPDDQLSFPQIGYKISGILGYPVIEAFGEIQITREGTMIIPETFSTFSGPSNMAMDGLTPLLCLEGDPYTFDTGADHTMLYAAYYQDNSKEIEEKYSTEKIQFGGAGGIREFDGFVIDRTFNISGKEITVEGVHLLQEKIKETETVYGNIGQDIMGQFQKMILNFDQMFILFE